MIGWQEIILIAVVVLILFGAKRIPELARSLGRASYEFKKAKNELSKDAEELVNASEKHAEAEDSVNAKPGKKPPNEG